jgi:hypothetical protein
MKYWMYDEKENLEEKVKFNFWSWILKVLRLK